MTFADCANHVQVAHVVERRREETVPSFVYPVYCAVYIFRSKYGCARRAYRSSHRRIRAVEGDPALLEGVKRIQIPLPVLPVLRLHIRCPGNLHHCSCLRCRLRVAPREGVCSEQPALHNRTASQSTSPLMLRTAVPSTEKISLSQPLSLLTDQSKYSASPSASSTVVVTVELELTTPALPEAA